MVEKKSEILIEKFEIGLSIELKMGSKKSEKENAEMSGKEKAEKIENVEVEVDENEVETAEAEEKDPLEELQEQYNELNNKYLMLYSDFENFRKRIAKERIDLIMNGGQDVFKLLLPVVDDFERARVNMESATDVPSVKEGMELIYHKLVKELENKGLKPMKSVGEVFDPEIHEAITQIPAPSKDMKGKVVDEVEKGYYLNEKVIRFAKVVVGA